MSNNGTHGTDAQQVHALEIDQNTKHADLPDPLDVTAESQPVSGEKAKPNPVEINNAKLNDTKVAFDSLRNMGICIAMLIGLPTLKDAAPLVPLGLSTLFSLFVMIAVLYLAYLNCRWAMQSMQEEPTHDWVYKPGQILLSVIAVLVIVVFEISTFDKLVLPWIKLL